MSHEFGLWLTLLVAWGVIIALILMLGCIALDIINEWRRHR